MLERLQNRLALANDRTIAVSVGCSALVIYSLFAIDRIFVRSIASQHADFAAAYLRGNLGLLQPMYELQQKGEFYFNPQGPMAAVFMMPYVAIFGPDGSDVAWGVLLAAATVGLFYLMLTRVSTSFSEISRRSCLLFTGIFAFGSFYFPYAVCGLFWYLSQLTSVFFIVLSLFAWFDPRYRYLSGFVCGLALGAAFLARYNVPLYGFVFLFLALMDSHRTPQLRLTRFMFLCAGLAIGVSLFFLHNYLRYEGILTTGYSAFYKDAIWSFNKIGPHLSNVFFTLPILYDTSPWIGVSKEGLSLFLTLPIFIFLVRMKYESSTPKAIALGCLPMFIFLMGYATNGWTQWGYRYLLEMLPFALIVLTFSYTQLKSRRLFHGLAMIGVIVNAYGAIILWRYEGLVWTFETFLMNTR